MAWLEGGFPLNTRTLNCEVSDDVLIAFQALSDFDITLTMNNNMNGRNINYHIAFLSLNNIITLVYSHTMMDITSAIIYNLTLVTCTRCDEAFQCRGLPRKSY